MKSTLPYFAFFSVFLFLAGCAGEPSQRQSAEVPTYGTADPYGSTVPGRQYGPQDRAGNQVQNGLPPWSNCRTTRC